MKQEQMTREAVLSQLPSSSLITHYSASIQSGDEAADSVETSNSRENLVRSAMSSMASAIRLMKQAIGDENESYLLGYTDATVDMISGKTDSPCDKSEPLTFFKFIESLARRYRILGKFRTAETLFTTLESLKRFRRNLDFMPEEIDNELIEDYNAYLQAQGLRLNTISFYNRVLRACYNRAVRKGLAPQRHPFQNVYTGQGKTVKRAIPIAAIKRIKNLDLSASPSLAQARDLFLFSFYTRGMSFIDMAYLRKTDISRGILSYRRRKTGQQLYIKWERCMQEIAERYRSRNSPYLLPIITNLQRDERIQVLSAQRVTNNRLKKIGIMARAGKDLTMYVSRHSWASIAHSKQIPLSVISEGMGHDSEATTRIYLANLNASIIDEANEEILRAL